MTSGFPPAANRVRVEGEVSLAPPPQIRASPIKAYGSSKCRIRSRSCEEAMDDSRAWQWKGCQKRIHPLPTPILLAAPSGQPLSPSTFHFRHKTPLTFALSPLRGPEVHQLRFIRVQLQAILGHSLSQYCQHSLRILFPLEAEHRVVGKSHHLGGSLHSRLDILDKPVIQHQQRGSARIQRGRALHLKDPASG